MSGSSGGAARSGWPQLRRWAAPATKVVHLVSAGAWVGCLVAVVAGSLLAPSLEGRASFGAVAVVFRLVDRVLPWTWYATIGTGLVFCLHLKWGFTRHVWVTVKWLLGGGLIAAALFWQGPVVARLAAQSDLGHAGWSDANRTARQVALVLLGLVALVFAISTFKPWGRLARAWHPPRPRTIVLVWASTAAVATASLVQSFALDRVRALDVDVRGGRIVGARALHNRAGTYPRLAEGVLARIVERQTVAVDAVTGATTTSKCLMAATRAALLVGERD